jgi:hypothetical protein
MGVNRKKRAEAGNRSRDAKWNAVIANKAMIAGAAQTGANARMKDVNQKAALQMMSQQGDLDVQGMRGNQQRSNTLLQGQNAVNLATERGAQGRQTNQIQNQFTADQGEQKNIWNKEGDNRAFVTNAMTRGVPIDAQMQNVYNTPGTSDAEMTGTQVPAKPVPPTKPTWVNPQFDNNGEMRPGTGQFVSPPGAQQQQQGATGGVSKGFNPQEPSPEDEAYLRNLAATGQYDLLRQIEAQYNF